MKGGERGGIVLNHASALKIIAKEYLAKGKKLFAALMNLEKTNDRVNRKGL